MVVSIGKNLSSLQVSRQLGVSSQRLSATFERLSSGLRINSAGDDPAGLAVSNQLEAKSRVLNRARLNLNDATSVLSLADSALGSVSGLLARMGELAAQSANGVFSLSQRQALNKEYQALDQEIRRIGASTTFNNMNILSSGEFSTSRSLLGDGDGGFNAAYLFQTSDNGRYYEGGTGILPTNIFYVEDSETGVQTTIDLTTDPELGGVTTADLLEITDSGIVILEATVGTETNLYRYDLNTQELDRLTTSSTADTFGPNGVDVSGDGRTLVFSSQTYYEDGAVAADGGVAGSSYRLYAMDLETGVVRTNGSDLANRLNNVEVSGDGTQIAYTVIGTPAEIFTVDATSGVSAATFLDTAIGYNFTDVSLQSIRDNGEVLVTTDEDPLGNGNSTSNFFVADVGAGTIAQITSFTETLSASSIKVSNDGTTIFFLSTANLTQENADNSTQLFRLDTTTGELEQLSSFTADSPPLGTLKSTTAGSLFAIETAGDDLVRFDFSEDDKQFDFEAGYGAAGNIIAAVGSYRDALSFLGNYTITSQTSSQNALDDINDAIASLADVRGKIGASLSRLEVANSLIQATTVELNAANSRIIDADIAQETAELTRLNILQQTGVALLAQTNLQPQIALQLING